MTEMKKILIVEDDRDMQLIYRYMLRGAEGKYAVEIVGSAREALDLLRGREYDLIISDIVMEVTSGEAFIGAIRGDRRNRELPVLVVTVLKPELLGRLKEMRGVYFLQKPIGEEQLFSKMENILGLNYPSRVGGMNNSDL